jgi:hypothetical protein
MSNIGSTGPLEVQKKDRRLLLTSLGLLALVGMVCAHCVPEAVAQQMDSVSSLHNHQHQAQCRRNIDQLARACANYAADHGRSPSHCSQLVPSYLSPASQMPTVQLKFLRHAPSQSQWDGSLPSRVSRWPFDFNRPSHCI